MTWLALALVLAVAWTWYGSPIMRRIRARRRRLARRALQ
jgi:hypothetical protein